MTQDTTLDPAPPASRHGVTTITVDANGQINGILLEDGANLDGVQRIMDIVRDNTTGMVAMRIDVVCRTGITVQNHRGEIVPTAEAFPQEDPAIVVPGKAPVDRIGRVRIVKA